jgi:hypothetical protein
MRNFYSPPILLPLLDGHRLKFYLALVCKLLSLEQRRDARVLLEESRGERSASRVHAQVLTRTGRAAVRAICQQELHRLTSVNKKFKKN